jgi:type II secretory pathway component PulF
MKPDEFAFMNQQLAGMIASGIPLEGALQQLCKSMGRGHLRAELESLQADLAAGTPLDQALSRRSLPEFYVHMLNVGVASNNLPAVLTLLADYYQRLGHIWMRLKGLLLYPAIVLVCSFVLSVALAVVYGRFLISAGEEFRGMGFTTLPEQTSLLVNTWLPTFVLGLLLAAVVLILTLRPVRQMVLWKLPAFREANLWRTASTFNLLLANGCTFDQSLALVRNLEKGSPAQAELASWQRRHAAGVIKFPAMVGAGRLFPPLFVWLVDGSGEEWAGGFQQAARIYYDRALHKIEMLLYAVLPVSVLGLGFLILTQVMPIVRLLRSFMSALSNVDGME